MPGARRRPRGSGRGLDANSVGIGALSFDPLHLEAVKPTDLRFDRRRTRAFEQVDAEVMVVSIPTQKPHYPTRFGHQLHAHRLVESLRTVEVRDVQMHMSEDGSIRELALRFVRNAQQPFEVEVICPDVQPAVWILPFAARTISVDLDSVSLGVIEIKGLADEMVSRAGHGQPLLQSAPEKTTQLFLTRQEDGEVKESGCMSRTFASIFQRFQAQKWSAARAKRGGRVSVPNPRQAEPLVKLSLALEVEDFQLDSPPRPFTHSGFNLPTTMPISNAPGILAERLGAQLLAGNPARDPASVVSRLLAVQAQDLRGARLAMRARTSRLTSARIDRAFTEERSIVITWLNRGTLHLVRSDDYSWLHSLTAAAVISANARRLQQEGVSAQAAERSVAIITRSLGNEGPLTRKQIGDHLRAGRVRVEGTGAGARRRCCGGGVGWPLPALRHRRRKGRGDVDDPIRRGGPAPI